MKWWVWVPFLLSIHDHGIGKLRSLIKHFHEEYDGPIRPVRVQLMSDEEHKKRTEFQEQINSYDIDV